MILGKYETNKIYNEDCYNAIHNLPDKCIDLVYMDPPYEYTSGFNERLGEWVKSETTDQVKQLSGGINYSFLDDLVRVMKYICIYIWCNDKQIIDYINYFVNQHNCDYKILAWYKNNPMPLYAKRFLDDCEYCLMFVEKGKTKFKGTDSYENSFKIYTGSINAKDKKLFLHPTIKPIECVRNHIQKTLSKGVCLDPFLGSGTTAVACKELGIDYIGFEINKEYYDIAVDRLNCLTQADKANHQQITIFDFIGDENEIQN